MRIPVHFFSFQHEQFVCHLGRASPQKFGDIGVQPSSAEPPLNFATWIDSAPQTPSNQWQL